MDHRATINSWAIRGIEPFLELTIGMADAGFVAMIVPPPRHARQGPGGHEMPVAAPQRHRVRESVGAAVALVRSPLGDRLR